MAQLCCAERLARRINLYLKEAPIATGVHYPRPHLQPYYRRQGQVRLPLCELIWRELLSLPICPDLTDEELEYIIETVVGFDRPERPSLPT